jgi:hypothetical protein
MNSNTYTDRGAAGAPARQNGTRTKVNFDANVPTFITLEREPPEWPVEGKFGDQFMYSLTHNQITWVEPVVHEKIVELYRKHRAREFCITRIKSGRSVSWDVQHVSDETRSQPRAATPAPAAAQESPFDATGRPSPNMMASAMRTALEAVIETEALAQRSGHAYKATGEDIRALAITIFIQACGGKK